MTTVKTPHLDGKHVVFGKVVQGMGILKELENQPVDERDRPKKACVIANCGEIDADEEVRETKVSVDVVILSVSAVIDL